MNLLECRHFCYKKGQSIVTNLYNIPTPLTLTYSSLMKDLTQIDLYPFWTDLLDQDLTTNLPQQCIGNLPTQTSICHWDSCQNLSAKCSVYKTLTHRARTFCVNPQLLQKEEWNNKGVLQKNIFLNWVLNKLRIKNNHRYNNNHNHKATNKRHNKDSNIHRVMPSTIGLSESLKNIYNKICIQVYCEGGKTIRNLLLGPKDKGTNTQKSRV